MEVETKNKVRPGYKQTEVGMIPEDWEIRTLGELTTLLTNGFVGKITDFYVESDDGVLYIQGYNVQENAFNLHGICRVSKQFHAAHQKSCLETGDLLTIQTGDIGVTTIVPPSLSGANCHALVISRLRKQQSEPAYYCHYFNSHRGKIAFKEIETGSTMKHLNVGDMVDLPLPCPSLLEQHAIGEALNDTDAFIKSHEQLIVKKRHTKQGAMQQLLTGKRRLPGFSGEWDVKPFDGVLARLNTKAHQIQTLDYQTMGRYPVVDQGKERVVGFSDRDDKRFFCPDGGVIVFGDHTCIVKFIDFDFLVGADGTQVLQAKDGQCTRFHAFQLQYKGIEPTGYNRHFKFLKEHEFPAPPLLEQIAIAKVLSDMDAEIAALEARRDKTCALKQGMMQELLTGKTRLI